MRGSSPVMYGATSFVGVIQVVHDAAGKGQRRASVAGGSYSTGAASVSTPFTWAGFDASLVAGVGLALLGTSVVLRRVRRA